MHLNFINMKKIAEKLRLLRQEKGFSQQYVADSIGVSVSTISTISRMENNPATINLGNYVQIAEFYEIELRKIFSDAEIEVQEKLARLDLHLSMPINFNSQFLFQLAKEVQEIELKE